MRRVRLDPYQDHDHGFVMIEPIPPDPADDWPAPFVARNDDLLPGYPPEESEPWRIESRAELRARAKADRLAARRAHLLRFLVVAGIVAIWLSATVVLLLLGRWQAAYYVGMGPIWLAIGCGTIWCIGKAIWIVTEGE